MRLSVAVVACAVILLAGCSKPTAEEYFAEAEAAQNAKNFPLAIETYSELVTEHPKTPLAEISLFKIAEIHHNETKDFVKAIEAYQRYISMYPDGVKAPSALFVIGFLYNNQLHNLDSAAAVYRRFLDRYPHDELASSALFELQNLGKSPEELIPHEDQEKEPPPKTTVKKPAREKKNV